MAPRAPRKLNPEVPPPPPPSLAQSVTADEPAEEFSLPLPTSEVRDYFLSQAFSSLCLLLNTLLFPYAIFL